MYNCSLIIYFNPYFGKRYAFSGESLAVLRAPYAVFPKEVYAFWVTQTVVIIYFKRSL